MENKEILAIINVIRQHECKICKLKDFGIDIEELSEPITGKLGDLVLHAITKREGISDRDKAYDEFADVLVDLTYDNHGEDATMEELEIVISTLKKKLAQATATSQPLPA